MLWKTKKTTKRFALLLWNTLVEANMSQLLFTLYQKKGRSEKKKSLVYQKHVQLEFLLCVVTARKPWTHDLEKVSIYARMRSKGDIRTFFSQVPNKLEWGWWGHGYFFIIVIETLLFFILRCARKNFQSRKSSIDPFHLTCILIRSPTFKLIDHHIQIY